MMIKLDAKGPATRWVNPQSVALVSADENDVNVKLDDGTIVKLNVTPGDGLATANDLITIINETAGRTAAGCVRGTAQ